MGGGEDIKNDPRASGYYNLALQQGLYGANGPEGEVNHVGGRGGKHQTQHQCLDIVTT